MGTSGSYSGGGGGPGRDWRREVDDWLDSLPAQPPPRPDDDRPDDRPPEVPPIPPEAVLTIVPLFRPRSDGGAGGATGGGFGGGGAGSGGRPGGRTGGGAQRSATRSASSAGRAAAAAYALRTGDAATLQALGLSYEDLRTNTDPIEVARTIVAAACGPLSDGTIEDDERRLVAAELAQWVLEYNEGREPPSPEEIVREAIARIIFEAASTESAAELRTGSRPPWATSEGERQIRDSAQALADRAELSATGPTVQEFERAIEDGIETLRNIWATT